MISWNQWLTEEYQKPAHLLKTLSQVTTKMVVMKMLEKASSLAVYQCNLLTSFSDVLMDLNQYYVLY